MDPSHHSRLLGPEIEYNIPTAVLNDDYQGLKKENAAITSYESCTARDVNTTQRKSNSENKKSWTRRINSYGVWSSKRGIKWLHTNARATQAKFFQVLVDDSHAIDAPKAKDPKGKEPKANDQILSIKFKSLTSLYRMKKMKALVKDAQPWESTTKLIRLLFEHYKKTGVVVDIDHEDKPKRGYVDFWVANAFLDELRLLAREWDSG